jgi:hypothetical protein
MALISEPCLANHVSTRPNAEVLLNPVHEFSFRACWSAGAEAPPMQ